MRSSMRRAENLPLYLSMHWMPGQLVLGGRLPTVDGWICVTRLMVGLVCSPHSSNGKQAPTAGCVGSCGQVDGRGLVCSPHSSNSEQTRSVLAQLDSSSLSGGHARGWLGGGSHKHTLLACSHHATGSRKRAREHVYCWIAWDGDYVFRPLHVRSMGVPWSLRLILGALEPSQRCSWTRQWFQHV